MTARPDVNAAVKANLEKVLEEEQRGAALRMAQIRLGLAGLALVVMLSTDFTNPALAPTVWGAVVFTVVSTALYGVTRFVPALGRWGTLAVALVDVPMISFIQHVQADRLPQAWHGLPTAVAIPSALVVLSMLSLSRRIIWITAAMATASIVRRLVSVELSFPPIFLTAIMPLGIGMVGSTLVTRLRSLVHAARKKDLVGKYILGERLGAGGMAEVFLATYSPEGGFERKVAVKRILPSYAEKPESVALFRREAELGAALAHPNVVQVLDFGADQDSWFIAMEYVDGVPLSRLITLARRSERPLPLPAVAFVLEQLAHALDYIHSRTSPTGTPLDLVHRDVNPPNVLVSRLGEVKLNDFGVARAAGKEQLTEAGMLRGKVGYSAPEQLLGQPYDTRADLWALGITAFELLALQRPFSAPDDVALYRACLEAPIPPVREVRAEVPAALEGLVLGLLVRDPAARIQQAREVLEGLGALGPEVMDRALGRRQLAALVAEARQSSPEANAFSATPSADAAATATATVTVKPLS